MVLSHKTWKSRSLPGLPRTETLRRFTFFKQKPRGLPRGFFAFAGDGRMRLGHVEPFQFVDDFRERTARRSERKLRELVGRLADKRAPSG